MSDEDLQQTIEALDKLREEIAGSPEKALAFLVSAGINQPDGELTEPYRS